MPRMDEPCKRKEDIGHLARLRAKRAVCITTSIYSNQFSTVEVAHTLEVEAHGHPAAIAELREAIVAYIASVKADESEETIH